MKTRITSRTGFLISTALGFAAVLPSQAFAQADPANDGLEEIVVTAQKREQNVQDVPIAVTALSGDTLVANRIVNVTDLTGLAPGVTIRAAAGGQALPSFSVRGAVSYGIVPGSDKQVSIYLDGVYISSPKGSIFDLPNVERIEMLRGPQGTLFGRNATAGAVSVTTREPTGKIGVSAEATVGNRNLYRFRTSVELPQVGPFSGYVNFTHEQRTGDIRNAKAGTVWNRLSAGSQPVAKILRSPKWLGSKDSNSWFAAIKFESGDFKTVYKYDHAESDNTPEGTALIGINRSVAGTGELLGILFDSQPTPVLSAPNGKRPKVVNNGWVIPTTQNSSGHSVTSTLQLADNLSIKNIFGVRKSYLFTASAIDGFSPLVFTQAAVPAYAAFARLSTDVVQNFVGQPFVGISTQPQGRSKQFSDEIQLNYSSRLLTVTAGALWFKGQDWTDETGYRTVSYGPVLNNVLARGRYGINYNKAVSIAAYTQLEFHVTPQVDIIAGGRITRDKKSGIFRFGTITPAVNNVLTFKYRDSRPNFLLGVNYKPTEDILLYGKYSTAFVSGGSVGGIPFQPETAKSWEAGVKAEMFDRRLRANLALYQATYKNFQTAQSAFNFCPEVTELTGDSTRCQSVGTFILPIGGPVKARGFEFDFSAAPLHGLTMGGSLAYSKTTFTDVNPKLISAAGGIYTPNAFRPKWNGGLWAQYQTDPLFGDAFISIRADGVWQSKMGLSSNPVLTATIAPALVESPAYWVVNGRLALRDLNLGGVKTELALWGRNLFDEDKISFSGTYAPIYAANYIPARSYGLDFSVKF